MTTALAAETPKDSAEAELRTTPNIQYIVAKVNQNGNTVASVNTDIEGRQNAMMAGILAMIGLGGAGIYTSRKRKKDQE